MKRKNRKVKFGVMIWEVLVLSAFLIMASFAADTGEQEPLPLHSQSAVLMDGKSGRVLWGKNEETVRPMASTTKIMTLITALEAIGEAEREAKVVEVSKHAASQPKVHLGMKTGQQFYLQDLFYSLMLESHNDSAVAIAEAVAGSVEGFAQQMNDKARQIGCENTWFITPNGLDGKEVKDGLEYLHSTTAADLARIMSYCVLESPEAKNFMEITRTREYAFADAQGQSNYHCVNRNALLSSMDGVLSGKTGFTSGAGYCYTAAVEDGGRVFCVALLGCGWPPYKNYKWADVRALIDYGKRTFAYRDVYQQIEFEPVRVSDGIAPGEELIIGQNAARASLDQSGDSAERELVVLLKESDTIKVVKNIPKQLAAPVEAGSEIGSVEYYLNDELLCRYPVYALDRVEKLTFEWSIRQMLQQFFLGVQRN